MANDAPIVIGEESNVQENCTIHVSRNMPVHIGNNVTVGHNAVLLWMYDTVTVH